MFLLNKAYILDFELAFLSYKYLNEKEQLLAQSSLVAPQFQSFEKKN